LLVSIAFAGSLYSSTVCNYLVLDETNTLRSSWNMDEVGFWCWEPIDGGGRYRYPDALLSSNGDEGMKNAMIFGYTANAIGLFLWILYLASAFCVKLPVCVVTCMSLLCLCAAFFESMKLWLFHSTTFCSGANLGCSLGMGAKIGIGAAAAWFVSGLCLCCIVKQRNNLSERKDSYDPRHSEDGSAISSTDSEEHHHERRGDNYIDDDDNDNASFSSGEGLRIETISLR